MGEIKLRGEQVRGALEALFYAASGPLTLEFLEKALRLPLEEITPALELLRADLNRPERGLILAEDKGGWTLLTKPEFASHIKGLAEYRAIGLSRAALETLAIVAFQQPVSRAEIEKIRGIDSDQVIQNLVQKELLELFEEETPQGKWRRLYRTTRQFLYYFGFTREFEMEEYFRKYLSTKESSPDGSDAIPPR